MANVWEKGKVVKEEIREQRPWTIIQKCKHSGQTEPPNNGRGVI